MGIINRLFGSDDPVKQEVQNNEADDEEDNEKDVTSGTELDPDSDDWPPYNVLLGKKSWPYEIDPIDNEMLSGREIYTIDDNQDYYAGKYVRDMIEDRQNNPEAPTRIGYAQDNVKGVQDVYIDHNALFRHIALFGQTGYGKSTLMRNIMLQWIQAGYGICYIDPKGADSKELMQQLPPNRIDDVVWVEPASPRERQVGFNIFATASDPGDPDYEREVNSVAGDFVQILKDNSDNWGPRLGNITETITKHIIRAPEPFNPIDFVKIITDQEELDAFTTNYGDEIEQVFMERIAQQDMSAFDPILRRVNSWVEDRVTRQVMAHEQSKINISEAVRQGKLLIINTSAIENNQTKEIITRMIISRVWSTIRTRNQEDPEPYFLCVDEFDKVISETFDINEIVSQARSFRLSVFVANQQPSQLPKDVKQAMQQVQSLFSFHPGQNPRDQQEIAQVLGDVESWKLGDLERFHVVGKPYMNESQQNAMVVKTYGEYPPIWTEEEGERIIEMSLEKYGTNPDIDDNLDKYGAKRFIDESDTGYELNDAGDQITDRQLLECIYTAQLRYDTEQIDGKEWVSTVQIKKEVGKYANNIQEAHTSKISGILESVSSMDVERRVGDDGAYYRLTEDGLKKAFNPDTGAAASGGKSPHRILLRKGHKSFTKLGYDVSLPSQDQAGKLPDGVADPPIKPMEESNDFEEAVKKEKHLIERYPRLAELFNDREVSLEAESTTITRPAQTIKNLIKAIKEDKHCVFLVKDGSGKRDSLEYWARAGENILTDPPFVRSVDEHGNRTFYTTNNKVSLSNGGKALVKKDTGQVSWKEYGKENGPDDDNIKIQLEATDSDKPLARFSTASRLGSDPQPSEFPYYYIRDRQSEKTIVKDESGDVVDEYENLKDLRKDRKYKPINMPIVPEYVFPGGEYPDPDNWTFIIIPRSENEGPLIYENGETEPLLIEDGAKIDPRSFEDWSVDVDIENLLEDKIVKDELDDIDTGDEELDDINDDGLIEGPDLDDIPSGDQSEDPINDLDGDDEPDITDSEINENIDDQNESDEQNNEQDSEEDSLSEKHKFPDPPD